MNIFDAISRRLRRTAGVKPLVYTCCAIIVVVAVLVGGVIASTQAYNECKANGDSTLWCLATLRWQVAKSIFSF